MQNFQTKITKIIVTCPLTHFVNPCIFTTNKHRKIASQLFRSTYAKLNTVLGAIIASKHTKGPESWRDWKEPPSWTSLLYIFFRVRFSFVTLRHNELVTVHAPVRYCKKWLALSDTPLSLPSNHSLWGCNYSEWMWIRMWRRCDVELHDHLCNFKFGLLNRSHMSWPCLHFNCGSQEPSTFWQQWENRLQMRGQCAERLMCPFSICPIDLP